MTKPRLMDLVFGPIPEGETEIRFPKLADILARFDTVELTSPVHPLLPDKDPDLVGRVRDSLIAGEKPQHRAAPLTDLARLVQEIIRDQLEIYIEPDRLRSERLYALEFQGAARQYVMFGHTTDLWNRVTEHQRAATPHGFAMLNGWASPWIDNDKAQPLEQVALKVGGMLHHMHYRERFFDMPFEMGLKIIRLVFELNTEVISVKLLGSFPGRAVR